MMGLGAEPVAAGPVTGAGKLAQALVNIANPYIPGGAPPPPPPPEPVMPSPGTLIAAGLAAWIGVPKIMSWLGGGKKRR